MSEHTEVAILGVINPVAVFVGIGNGGPTASAEIEKVIKEARKQAADLDISTPSGRTAIASLAYKVAKSKTALDGLGKELTEDAKLRIKSVDIERKSIRDRLDELKEEIRKPLTDWENKESDRVAAHKRAVSEIGELTTRPADDDIEMMTRQLDHIIEISGRSWEEFEAIALPLIADSKERLTAWIADSKKALAEKEELDRLRKENELREAKERDERIAKEAADKAKAAAEEKAAKEKAEAKRIADAEEQRSKQEFQDALDAEKNKAAKEKEESDKAKREAEQREERALQEKKEAEERAKQATENERLRIEREAQAEKDAAEKREANKKHNAKINNAALKAFVSAGLSEDDGKLAVQAIAKNKIPNVSISY